MEEILKNQLSHLAQQPSLASCSCPAWRKPLSIIKLQWKIVVIGKLAERANSWLNIDPLDQIAIQLDIHAQREHHAKRIGMLWLANKEAQFLIKGNVFRSNKGA